MKLFVIFWLLGTLLLVGAAFTQRKLSQVRRRQALWAAFYCGAEAYRAKKKEAAAEAKRIADVAKRVREIAIRRDILWKTLTNGATLQEKRRALAELNSLPPASAQEARHASSSSGFVDAAAVQ